MSRPYLSQLRCEHLKKKVTYLPFRWTVERMRVADHSIVEELYRLVLYDSTVEMATIIPMDGVTVHLE